MEEQVLKKIQEIEKKYLEKEKKLRDPNIFSDFNKTKDLQSYIKKNSKVLNLFLSYQEKNNDIKEIEKLLKIEKDKNELIVLKKLLNEEKNEVDKIDLILSDLLIEVDPEDEKDAIIEIKGAVGGEEANIFAADLFEMYKKFALKNNFKIEVNEEIKSDMGGYSFIAFQIIGDGAYGLFKYEGGVHRVQRVPATESMGRVHTSTATVSVVPDVDIQKVKIIPSDLRIDTFRSSGAGGQHVNTTDSAVRVTHLPTGIVASSQDGRSQHDNKDKAMQLLKAKIIYQQQEKIQQEKSQNKKLIIGNGERSEKIRTYNYPQNRITDHRINLTLKKLSYIMAGNLEEIVSVLNKVYYEK